MRLYTTISLLITNLILNAISNESGTIYPVKESKKHYCFYCAYIRHAKKEENIRNQLCLSAKKMKNRVNMRRQCTVDENFCMVLHEFE